MKRIFILLLSLSVLLVFSACSPSVSAPSHTHNYTDSITREATCTESGIRTYTCACGASYTEDIPPTSHNWGQWQPPKQPFSSTQAEKTRSCQDCPAKETLEYDITLDDLFAAYVPFLCSDDFAWALGEFQSLQNVDIERFIVWASAYVVRNSHNEGNLLCSTFKIENLNTFTKKYFDCTLDYSNTSAQHGTLIYDFNSNSITYVRDMSFGGSPRSVVYTGYTQIDDTHYIISYDEYDFFEPSDSPIASGTITVECRGGNYIILSHQYA